MRAIVSVMAGFLAWWIVASILSLGAKSAWPGYAAAEPAMQFTFGMLVARLVMGALSTLAAGWTTCVVSRGSRNAALGLGVLLLLVFVPVHVQLFAAFPIWYHAVFLCSLVPLSVLPWRLVAAQGGRHRR